jgi:hypothetical protein
MTLESAAAFLKLTAGIDAQQCPCCGAGRLRVVQALARPGRAGVGCGSSGGQAPCDSCESLRSRALRSETCQPARLPVPAQLWLAKGAGTSP